MNTKALDLTNYFVCPVCRSIQLKENKIILPLSLLCLKNPHGEYIFEICYCPDCILIPIKKIVNSYGMLDRMKYEYESGQLNSVFKEKMEQFLKEESPREWPPKEKYSLSDAIKNNAKRIEDTEQSNKKRRKHDKIINRLTFLLFSMAVIGVIKYYFFK